MCAQSHFRESLDLFVASNCTFPLENSREVDGKTSWKPRREREKQAPEMKHDEAMKKKEARRSSSN
jgi:hypothetical protein